MVLNKIGKDRIIAYHKNIILDTILFKNNYRELSNAIINTHDLDSMKNAKSWQYLKISKPVFSLDSNYALIEVDCNCFGLCGHGDAYL